MTQGSGIVRLCWDKQGLCGDGQSGGTACYVTYLAEAEFGEVLSCKGNVDRRTTKLGGGMA